MNNNISDVADYINGKMETRYNMVTGMVQYKLHQTDEWLTITDRLLASIVVGLKNQGIKVSLKVVKELMISDFSPPFHPFSDYFNWLPTWDGETDYIEQLSDLVKVDNPKYWKKVFKKWVVSVVAGCTQKGKPNHQMLVLTGGQGIGKTSFFLKLIPLSLKEYATSGIINPTNKDDKILAGECFMILIDELAGFNQSNLEAMKQLITLSSFKVRRPYASSPEIIDRVASFCGTTNEDQFLIDPTGNRRFLIAQSTDIDLKALRKFPIDKMWAQATALLDDGFKHWFDKKDNLEIEKVNKEFLFRNQEEEALLSLFEPCERGLKDLVNYYEITASAVTRKLADRGLVTNASKTVQKIGQALSKNGFTSFKTMGQKKYVLRRK